MFAVIADFVCQNLISVPYHLADPHFFAAVTEPAIATIRVFVKFQDSGAVYSFVRPDRMGVIKLEIEIPPSARFVNHHNAVALQSEDRIYCASSVFVWARAEANGFRIATAPDAGLRKTPSLSFEGQEFREFDRQVRVVASEDPPSSLPTSTQRAN